MTLDEAIKYFEEMVEIGETYDVSKIVEENRQLLEWLKNYKRLLEQQSCEDAISRQAVKELYYKCGYIDFRKICDLPPVNPQPKVGHWIGVDQEPHEDWECDNCGHIKYANEDVPDEYHFCPNCGVKMVESQGSEG